MKFHLLDIASFAVRESSWIPHLFSRENQTLNSSTIVTELCLLFLCHDCAPWSIGWKRLTWFSWLSILMHHMEEVHARNLLWDLHTVMPEKGGERTKKPFCFGYQTCPMDFCVFQSTVTATNLLGQTLRACKMLQESQRNNFSNLLLPRIRPRSITKTVA